MGLIKTLKVSEDWRVSLNCVKETLQIKQGDEVEIHVSNGTVSIKKKEVT